MSEFTPLLAFCKNVAGSLIMKKINLKPIPKHVAIIMDGNGRWAKSHGLSRSEGHRRGAKRVLEIVEEAVRLKIEVITLYAFSIENWRRPRREVNLLMQLLNFFLKKELRNLNKNNIRFSCIGRIEQLPGSVQNVLGQAKESTKKNTGMILNLALNYGSRAEIVDAVNKIIRDKSADKLKSDLLHEADFQKYLDTAGLPDPDLLIRTSGEQRISNFLLWQISYSELLFIEKLWPDFTKDDFHKAICTYQRRSRRFGGI